MFLSLCLLFTREEMCKTVKMRTEWKIYFTPTTKTSRIPSLAETQTIGYRLQVWMIWTAEEYVESKDREKRILNGHYTMELLDNKLDIENDGMALNEPWWFLKVQYLWVTLYWLDHTECVHAYSNSKVFASPYSICAAFVSFSLSLSVNVPVESDKADSQWRDGREGVVNESTVNSLMYQQLWNSPINPHRLGKKVQSQEVCKGSPSATWFPTTFSDGLCTSPNETIQDWDRRLHWSEAARRLWRTGVQAEGFGSLQLSAWPRPSTGWPRSHGRPLKTDGCHLLHPNCDFSSLAWRNNWQQL